MSVSSIKIKISILAVALVILVLLGPLFDLGTGYYQGIYRLQGSYQEAALTPGVIYRGLFLIPAFLILMHLAKSPVRFLVYYFGAIFMIGVLIRGVNIQELDLVRDTQRFLKLMLPIFGFAGLIVIAKYFTDNKPTVHFWRTAGLYGFITAFGLITTNWLGLSLRVYRGQTIASAGLIDSHNSAALILLISLPLALYYIYKFHNNNIILVLVVEAIWLASAFQLSTRAALVGIPIIIAIYHPIVFLKGRYTKSALHAISYTVLILLTLLIGYILFQNWASQNIQFIIDRFNLLAEGHFRNRVPIGMEVISKFTVSEHLFGLGDATFITVENDIVDIYGKFGLLILLPVILFVLYFHIRLITTFLRFRQLSTLTLIFSYTLYVLHGFIAGHAFLSSPVNNLFLLIYTMSYMEIKRFETKAAPETQRPMPVGIEKKKSTLAYDT